MNANANACGCRQLHVADEPGCGIDAAVLCAEKKLTNELN